MARIIQGEQYAIEIVLTDENETVISPSTADDVKIKIGNIEKSYGKGELSYDNGAWLFPLTQEQTLCLKTASVGVQAQYLLGSNVISTDLVHLDVGKSIIRTTFNE